MPSPHIESSSSQRYVMHTVCRLTMGEKSKIYMYIKSFGVPKKEEFHIKITLHDGGSWSEIMQQIAKTKSYQKDMMKLWRKNRNDEWIEFTEENLKEFSIVNREELRAVKVSISACDFR